MRKETVFVIAMLCSSIALSHGDHAPKAAKCVGECTQEQIEAAVPEAITMLTKMGKIDATWANAKVEKVEQKKFKKGAEWVATLLDEKQADAKKQRLYVFITTKGRLNGSNFTGD